MNINKKTTIEYLMNSPFSSGGLMVNFSQNRVEYQQTTLVLQPKVLELLVQLCAAQGQTLSKQTLTAALWSETIVGPDSLANSVTRLRKALDDDARNPQFIETVQRKGYRWLPQVDVTPEIGIPKRKMTSRNITLSLTGMAIAVLVSWAMFTRLSDPISPVEAALPSTVETKAKVGKFPFPDLHIIRLPEGGYEIQVGVDGELTEARKIAMLKEIKRITGEEHSDMIFTIDRPEPDCKAAEHMTNVKGKAKEKVVCTDKPLKNTNH